MRSFLITSLAAALALSSPALAQKAHELTPAGGAGKAVEQQQGKEVSSWDLDSINRLTKGLEREGYSDFRVISNSFLMEAKDKRGNVTVLALSPSGVFEVIGQKQAKAATAGSNAQRE
jgi:hypothetical protein